MSVETSVFVDLNLSSWMMWAAEGMRQTLLIALTMELASTTVVTVEMQE